MKPWSNTIPDEDRNSFRNIERLEDRPLAAGTRPSLIIVDMVRECVDDSYPVGCSRTGIPAVEANARLLAAARDRGIPVFFTKDWPDPEQRVTEAEKGLWKGDGEAQRRGLPPGDVIVESLTPKLGEIVIHKGSKPSGFFGTPLASYLTFHAVDTTIITGMLTSVCVRATAVDAFQHNYRVVIPYECVADHSQISHLVSLFDLHMKHADVVSLQETLDYIARVPSSGIGATV
jgi:nicotinamidase-related amidase